MSYLEALRPWMSRRLTGGNHLQLPSPLWVAAESNAVLELIVGV
jgi:hypothetical protein